MGDSVVILVFPVLQWGGGWLSGPSPPTNQHGLVTTETDHQSVQVGAAPPAHVQTDHLHGRTPALVQRTWDPVQRGLCHRYERQNRRSVYHTHTTSDVHS